MTTRMTIPTGRRLKTLFTAEELLCLPADGRRLELVKGRVYEMPLADERQTGVAVRMGAALDAHVKGNELGAVFSAGTGFVLGRDPDTVRAADAAFVTRERIPEIGVHQGCFPMAPDLAVEVVSPQDRPLDVREKIEDWLEGGTRLVWVVQRVQRIVTVYRPLGDPTEFSEGATLDGEEVIPGFTCAVQELFV